jgi:hypothetical protein
MEMKFIPKSERAAPRTQADKTNSVVDTLRTGGGVDVEDDISSVLLLI